MKVSFDFGGVIVFVSGIFFGNYLYKTGKAKIIVDFAKKTYHSVRDKIKSFFEEKKEK